MTASTSQILVELPHDPLVERFLVSAIGDDPALLADEPILRPVSRAENRRRFQLGGAQ